jgi:flagellar basal-body rod modification protein FlgD
MNIQGITPTIAAPQAGQSANNTAAAASSTSSSSGSNLGLSSSSLESTFLNLLVTELQNQDPTQPVDPTEMVGQMVSLNQLDQLISINQTLQNMSTGSSTAASTSAASQAVRQAATNAANTAAAVTATPALTGAQLQATPYSTAGNSNLMNLYGSYALPSSTTNSISTGVR